MTGSKETTAIGQGGALMRQAATRLWRDDLAYAERRYQLRASGVRP